MKPKILIVVIAILAISLCASLFCLSRAVREKTRWQWEAVELANFKGSERALCDFRAGELRLFVLGGESRKDTYTGTNDGPFEVWIPQYYPPRGSANLSSMERWIAVYDHQMRYMRDHPDKYLETTNHRPNTALEPTRTVP